MRNTWASPETLLMSGYLIGRSESGGSAPPKMKLKPAPPPAGLLSVLPVAGNGRALTNCNPCGATVPEIALPVLPNCEVHPMNQRVWSARRAILVLTIASVSAWAALFGALWLVLRFV